MKVRKMLAAALALAIMTYGSIASAAHIIPGSLSETIVESRSGGLNFAKYSESPAGFPNSWANSASKSTAPGTTAGIGSRFNSNAGIGGAATWFQVNPTLPTAGGLYGVYVTVTDDSGALAVTSGITTNGGTGLPPATTAFSSPPNVWNLVGTLLLNAGVNNPTVRFNETANSLRFYADAVLFAEIQVIPEPSTFALAGLALVGVAVAARRKVVA